MAVHVLHQEEPKPSLSILPINTTRMARRAFLSQDMKQLTNSLKPSVRPMDQAAITSTQGNLSADAYVAYADGSSLGNPGPAGWAFIIVPPDGRRLCRAGSLSEHTTNNRAEITAAIHALLALPCAAQGVLYLDSEYVVKAVNGGRQRWEANGWKNANGQGVSNADALKVLFGLVDARSGIRLDWVRGHSGVPLNELVDRLARAEAEKVREEVFG